MNGFFGIIGKREPLFKPEYFIESINLAGTMTVDSVSGDNYFFGISYLQKSPLIGDRIYRTENFVFLFSGDLINYQRIPWEEIEEQFLSAHYSWFSSLKGFFALAVYDLNQKTIALVSDYFAQYPVYYGNIENNFIFSTDLSTFSVTNSVPDFNIKWLFEYFYFNMPINQTTFFKGVYRMKPFTILKYVSQFQPIEEIPYSQYFKGTDHLLTGKKALKKCSDAFKSIIPSYYSKNKVNLVAISGGFDSRTILSLAPVYHNIKTYTYGVEDCKDLNDAEQMLHKLHIDHRNILFGDEFVKSLPDLIYDSVRLSGGVQSILRSTLLHVYRNLSELNSEASTVLGGINGDFYRGWDLFNANTSVTSIGVKIFHRTGKIKFEEEIYSKIFRNDFVDFKNHVIDSLEDIRERYGPAMDPKNKMCFSAFQITPRYFGGEMAIAGNFFVFRQPFLDPELMQLAFETECGYFGLTKRRKEKGDTTYKQYVLQSQVIYSNPEFKNSRIRGVPIMLYAIDSKWIYNLSRPLIRSLDYLFGYRKPKNDLEEWDDWFGSALRPTFNRLLNDDSMIINYIDKDFMMEVKESKNIHLISKLVTTEIILNLMKSKWDIKPKIN